MGANTEGMPEQHARLWDRAAASPNGLVVELDSFERAVQVRQRLYVIRANERKALRKEFGPKHLCPWDDYKIELKGTTLRIVKHDVDLANATIKEL